MGDAAPGSELDVSYLLRDKALRELTGGSHSSRNVFSGTSKLERANDDDDDDESIKGDENNPPLMPTVETFDEAIQRACTPDTKTGLFDLLGGSVSMHGAPIESITAAASCRGRIRLGTTHKKKGLHF